MAKKPADAANLAKTEIRDVPKADAPKIIRRAKAELGSRFVDAFVVPETPDGSYVTVVIVYKMS